MLGRYGRCMTGFLPQTPRARSGSSKRSEG
jgi:hypothetical protein